MTGLVLLAAYPKSGNTWLRAALLSLRHQGRPVALDALAAIPNAARRLLFDEMLGIETSDLTADELAQLRPAVFDQLAAEAANALLPVKVHDALLGPAPGSPPPFRGRALGAVLYLVRDPRDVAVSLAAHRGETLDRAIERLADPTETRPSRHGAVTDQVPQLLSSWSRHVESWLDAPAARVHLLRYEDMAAAPVPVYGGIARFLALPAEPATLEAAAAATSFDALRAQEDQSGFRERPDAMARFFRRGRAGGWRDTLSPAQAARVVRDHGAVMGRLGYAA